MALQGDLSSFALPDVLRLLAGTKKSGVLEISGPAGAGEVQLREGVIEAGLVLEAPKAVAAADVVFELLRFDSGSFTFVDGEVAPQGAAVEVDDALEAAEQLMAEWAEVETVVPSMDAWISLAAEPEGESVELSADQWRAVVAIGSGGNVRDLANARGLTDLVACRQVKELAEAQLVEVRATHGYTVPAVELDSFEEFELTEPMAGIEDLSSEDRPVLLEESEGALLPEPLPGAGVAYDGGSITGSVDGRAPEEADEPEVVAEPVAEVVAEEVEVEVEVPVEPEAEPEVEVELAPAAEADESMDAAIEELVAEERDDERGSLLKFLSSVKP